MMAPLFAIYRTMLSNDVSNYRCSIGRREAGWRVVSVIKIDPYYLLFNRLRFITKQPF
jgi:hypothetical protein